ncbi:unnamed protein product [Scytosiphon promiscuus]
MRSFGMLGCKAEVCARHRREGMVALLRKKRCSHPDCTKCPIFGVRGSKRAEFCRQHATDEMVDVCNKRCREASCGRAARFGVDASTERPEYCALHIQYRGQLITALKPRTPRTF